MLAAMTCKIIEEERESLHGLQVESYKINKVLDVILFSLDYMDDGPINWSVMSFNMLYHLLPNNGQSRD